MNAEELMKSRFSALNNGDFIALYATYHRDSPFMQQFADCEAYVSFARQQLNSVEVTSWQVMQQRQLDDQQQEQLLVMELSAADTSLYFYELALLVLTADGWRYHSAQKLSAEDYPGPPEQISFAHFEQVSEKIRY